MQNSSTISEEELKSRIGKEYFSNFDYSRILGKIDFCVAPKTKLSTENISILWAESKRGYADSTESFIQLVLTIGRARTFNYCNPPKYLAAFDAEKIAFLPYSNVRDVFYQNDFNWKVAASDHSTKEFKQLENTISEGITANSCTFYFDRDDKILREFIKSNFKLDGSRDKIQVDKNNFMIVYNHWIDSVKPTISANWEKSKQHGIIDADFYLADLLAEENLTLKQKLFVLLEKDHYNFNRIIDDDGFFNEKHAYFNDKMKAHTAFWNIYDRPPRREYWDYIVERRDLLVPQDVRERKGSFFTPRKWVELSQKYLADALGKNWQDEYYIWDCCAGTGNLLAGLTNKANIWASTLDRADVDVMLDRIANGANLLPKHVFQFDFLNDSFDDVPDSLKEIINDTEKRKKLVIYINPPYAEAGNARQRTGTGLNKEKVAINNKIHTKYSKLIKKAGNELFTQFLIRIYDELKPGCIGQFSKLKHLQAPNFSDFRNIFNAKLEKLFLIPANSFDNVKGQFPIGFHIWNCNMVAKFKGIKADVYDKNSIYKNKREIFCYDNYHLIIQWLRNFYDKKNERIAYLRMIGCDIQNCKGVFITNLPSKNDIVKKLTTNITQYNIIYIAIYLAVRHCIPATWLNDRDQFLFPIDGWQDDKEFQSNCLAYTLFHGQNRITSSAGVNHWIPFREDEVGAPDSFSSHFMTDFIEGKIKPETSADLFSNEISVCEKIVFSPTAERVFDAGRELWRYYMQQDGVNVNASLYDIREFFQGRTGSRMNNKSGDARYNELIAELRARLNDLADQIAPKVYEYEFLK